MLPTGRLYLYAIMRNSITLNGAAKCTGCENRSHNYFCELPHEVGKALDAIKFSRSFPKGSIIFLEGQPAHGVYILCEGKVKITSSSPDGKVIILDIVSPGSLMGLSSVMSGGNFETTAASIEDAVVNYISAPDFDRFLHEHPAACFNAAVQLSSSLRRATRQVCALGLGESVADKLATLFLDWSSGMHCNGNSIVIRNAFTHEDIARMIGTSRETVTRALRTFREIGVVTLKGSELVIHDRERLRSVIGCRLQASRNDGLNMNGNGNAL
ncbi:MAG: Crp/Fnr family transcriptional regulator [Acidobacteria bacterium]|nr:Crp/Fnr family transcriptional regulator [Acidobacteriota bacterium]